MKAKLEKKNELDVIRIPMQENSNWEQWVLMQSDEHFDSKYCNRKLLKKHHELAKERNAIILKFGDLFDCMGGKYDPRSSKGDIRPEYMVKGYFDAIVKDAARFYEPYKENIFIISTGNHEESILRRQEVDILNNLCYQLGVAEKRDYTGFIRFHFKAENNKYSTSKTLYYTHGDGGSSPVTRGTIKTNRRQTFIRADLIVSGHIHMNYYVPLPYVEVSEQGYLKKREQEHISLGTYKDDSMTGGWADSKGFAPPNMGGYWVRFYYDHSKKDVDFELIRAK